MKIYQLNAHKLLENEDAPPYTDLMRHIAHLPWGQQLALLQQEIRAHFVRNFPTMHIAHRDDFWVYISRLLYLLEGCRHSFYTKYEGDFEDVDVQEIVETELYTLYYSIKKAYEGMLQDFELYDEETRYYKAYMVQQTYKLDLTGKEGLLNINYDTEQSEISVYKKRIVTFLNSYHWNGFLVKSSRFVGKFAQELQNYLQDFQEEMKKMQETAQINQTLARNDLVTTFHNYKQLKKKQRKVAMEVHFTLKSGTLSFVLASQKDKLQIARWASIDCFVLSLLGFLFTKVASYTQFSPIFSFLMIVFTTSYILTEIMIGFNKQHKIKE
jgi:hypothetical protein